MAPKGHVVCGFLVGFQFAAVEGAAPGFGASGDDAGGYADKHPVAWAHTLRAFGGAEVAAAAGFHADTDRRLRLVLQRGQAIVLGCGSYGEGRKLS